MYCERQLDLWIALYDVYKIKHTPRNRPYPQAAAIINCGEFVGGELVLLIFWLSLTRWFRQEHHKIGPWRFYILQRTCRTGSIAWLWDLFSVSSVHCRSTSLCSILDWLASERYIGVGCNHVLAYEIQGPSGIANFHLVGRDNVRLFWKFLNALRWLPGGTISAMLINNHLYMSWVIWKVN